MQIRKRITNLFKLSFIEESARDKKSFVKAETIVSLFYFIQIAFAFLSLIKIGGGEVGRSGFLPIWPISWVGSLEATTASKVVFLFYLASSFFATLFWRRRIGKIIGFLGILQIHAWDSSFGYMNHFLYPWLYTSFLFIFLPDTHKKGIKLKTRKKFMLVFWGAQALFLLTYTLSGLWKVYWGVRQPIEDQLGSFSAYGFSYQAAAHFLRDNRSFLLTELVINNPIPAWLFYLGGIYTEFFAIWAAFKPNLHKLWGLLLIGLHVGILFVLGIPFFESIVLLSLLFLNSPFSKNPKVNDIAKDLPIFGYFIAKSGL